MRKLLITAALALPACTNTMNTDTLDDGTSTRSMADASLVASSPAEYVSMAGASDLYEIESSQLALQRSSNSEIQQFARTMIDHHTMTTNRILAAARQAGMNPAPPQLMPMQQQMVNELRGARGATFDRLYLEQQRRAHQMALKLHSSFADDGTSAPLRETARVAVPVIEDHIQRLRSMPEN